MYRTDEHTVVDCAILGAGHAGVAAALAARRYGWSTLLIDPDAALLWESSRCGMQAIGEADTGPWADWVERLRHRGAADARYLDGAVAEIQAAAELQADPDLHYLAPAQAVAVRMEAGLLQAVLVATKAGTRVVCARRWIDASEVGSLLRLCTPGAVDALRAPSRWQLHAHWLAGIWPAIAELDAGLPADLEWQESPWPNQRVLAIRCAMAQADPMAALQTARTAVAGRLPEDAVLSHHSLWPLGLYADDGEAPGLQHPANLTLALPGAADGPVCDLGARFRLGLEAVRRNADGPVAPGQPTQQPTQQDPTISVLREIDCDVLVAGGGTGGALAGIAAAQAGARTQVIDHQALLGGIGTGGLITGHWHGHPGGLGDQIDAAVRAAGEPFGDDRVRGWHHLTKRLVLQQQLEQAGGNFLGRALVVAVERVGRRPMATLVATAEGPLRIRHQAAVDATGDGDLAVLAGARARSGRPGDGLCLAFTQSTLWLSGDDSDGPRLQGSNHDAGYCDATDPTDLSRARCRGLAQFLQDRYETWNRPVWNAPVLGLRQSRHIVCDQHLDLDDLIAGRPATDSIGRSTSCLDTHAVDYAFEDPRLVLWSLVLRCFRTPLSCEIPYGCLLPAGLDRLWIGCRALDVDQSAAYAIRMMRDVQRIGAAAGTAAALCVQEDCDSRALPLPLLQERLREQGDLRESQALQRRCQHDRTEALAALDEGRAEPGAFLIAREPAADRQRLRDWASADDRRGFLAACLLGIGGDTAAEPRLLQALRRRENGPDPDRRARGPFGTVIVLPDWALSLLLLGHCGTLACLSDLQAAAAADELPHDLRCIIALSAERLLQRLGDPVRETVCCLADQLLAGAPPAAPLPPIRSLWQRLHHEEDRPQSCATGAVVHEDQRWQLDLVVARIRRRCGIPTAELLEAHRHDPRAHVRRAVSGAEAADVLTST